MRRPHDLGRLLARLLCALFALVGAVPLAGGFLVRSAPVRSWAARETARVLEEQLGVQASYRVEMELWPLSVSLRDLSVPASDGGGPALTAARVAVTPGLLALLSGRLDVGEIELDAPRGRLVIEDGKLVNVAYRLPERTAPSGKPMTRAPFTSLGVSNAHFDVTVDGVSTETGAIDFDVFAGVGPSFDVSLRMGETHVVRRRHVKTKARDGSVTESDATDEDVLCRLDLRVHYEPNSVLVRRLSLQGVADSRPEAGTRPECKQRDPGDEDPWRVVLRLSQVRVTLRADQTPLVAGHVVVRAPVELVNRFVAMSPLSGWVGVAGDLSWDGSTKLPEARLRVRAGGISLGDYHLAKYLDGTVNIVADAVESSRINVGIADADVIVSGFSLKPFAPGMPLSVAHVDGTGCTFPGLMRDLDVTPNTIVRWDLDATHVKNFHGTINPLQLDGELHADTRNFEVFDRAWHSPSRRRMIGVKSAVVRGKIGVRPGSFDIYDTRADFGDSSMLVNLVSIGFHLDLKIDVDKSSRLDLADISPLVTLPISGKAELGVELKGNPHRDLLLTGDLAVRAFSLAGFPIGDVSRAKVRFRPLKVDFLDLHGRKGHSDFVVPSARLTFDEGSSVKVEALVNSDKMDVRDFFAMFHFDQDPRFDQVLGEGKIAARVHYDLGGQEDRCGGGFLHVAGASTFDWVGLFEEHYDSGAADFDFTWGDRDASYLGLDIAVPSVVLRKGPGTLLGSFSVKPGGILRGQLVGTALPLAKLSAMDPLGKMVDATVSAVADVGGTVDAMTLDTHVHISPVRIGGADLPASDVDLRLVPVERPLKVVGHSKCGAPVTAAFSRSDYDADHSLGTFHARGDLFGGQLHFDDVRFTRQRKKHVEGDLRVTRLDLGTIAQLAPSIALSDSRPTGYLSGLMRIEDMPLDAWRTDTRAYARMTALHVEQGGAIVALEPGAETLTVADGKIGVPRLTLAVRTPGGARGVFDLHAAVTGVGTAPNIDATLDLRPTDLSAFTGLTPRVERASGKLQGRLRVSGKPSALAYEGGFSLSGGEVALHGMGTAVTGIELGVEVGQGELRISRGSARIGAGRIEISGGAPLHGFEIGAARGVITVRDLAVPSGMGVRGSLDADLVATWQPPSADTERGPLPRVVGDVMLRSFEYTRPVTMTADLNTLTQRGKRTEVESYDPEEDAVSFEIVLRSDRPLKIQNNLVEAELVVGERGLILAGTNQRFGLRGSLDLRPGGHIRLRRSDFEIRQGVVRFDDLTRIAPEVDVSAVTEYRRYSDSVSSGATSSTSGAAQTASVSSTSAVGGRWRITLYAHGDADNLRVDLTSDPALAQDDIFLLLTVGLTRAELDQAQSASVGESVALEALGTLTGADKAVAEALPVIDEFRFGSAYSSRTGRTEPTVTVGKRLTDRVRANVTTGLSESREVRSNLEVRLSPRVSVEGSYDNVNDLSSSLGNLGANLRWRLEFE